MKQIRKMKRDAESNHKDKMEVINQLYVDLGKTIADKKYHQVGSYCLELIQFCESITDLEYSIRQYDIFLDDL